MKNSMPTILDSLVGLSVEVRLNDGKVQRGKVVGHEKVHKHFYVTILKTPRRDVILNDDAIQDIVKLCPFYDNGDCHAGNPAEACMHSFNPSVLVNYRKCFDYELAINPEQALAKLKKKVTVEIIEARTKVTP